MTELLMIVVVGTVLLAIGVDVAAAWTWLRSRWP
jgi:hypothetical protein